MFKYLMKLLKIFDENDSVKKELEDSMKDRTALRTKHYNQLEKKKTNLDQLKVKIKNLFPPNNLTEIEYPNKQDDSTEVLGKGIVSFRISFVQFRR